MIKQSMFDSKIISKRLVKGKVQYKTEIIDRGYVVWVEFIGDYLKIVG